MNKSNITILLLSALTTFVVSSCPSPAPMDHSQHQSMPGMTPKQHAQMKKDGSMSGMKM